MSDYIKLFETKSEQEYYRGSKDYITPHVSCTKDGKNIKYNNPFEMTYVDLGLPSGTLWASCNLGAHSPTEIGDYYAWGETEAQSVLTYTAYKFNGDTKYDISDRVKLELDDDASFAKLGMSDLGAPWQTPSMNQWLELIENCIDSYSETRNGVNCWILQYNSGKELIFPISGSLYYTEIYNDYAGYYWTNRLNHSDSSEAYCVVFDTDREEIDLGSNTTGAREEGFQIRPVIRPYEKIPLTIKPVNGLNGTSEISFNLDSSSDYDCPDNLYVSYDEGFNWNPYSGSFIELDTDATVSFKSDDVQAYAWETSSSEPISYWYFDIGGRLVDVYGNLGSMSCNNWGTNEEYISLSVDGSEFYHFFQNSWINSAENLILPFLNLTEYCYAGMFQNSEIKILPKLPATVLAEGCYSGMFSHCNNLTSINIDLPATIMKERCYYAMFRDCIKLESIPETLLQATTLADYCYADMFNGCTSLITLPEKLLNAAELKNYCYGGMFGNCSNLKHVPKKFLPSLKLDEACYSFMFAYCSNLIHAPALPAKNMKSSCYRSMFQNCISMEIAPVLPATTLKEYCYDSMFYGCTKLCFVKAMLMNTSDNNKWCTLGWLENVASTGTFVKYNMSSIVASNGNWIPSTWNVISVDYESE